MNLGAGAAKSARAAGATAVAHVEGTAGAR
jgi:hypothetical protein